VTVAGAFFMDQPDAPVDIAALVAAAGTEGRALEYLALFQRQLSVQRAALGTAKEEGLSDRAHDIAGMAAYCRAGPLQDAARALQRAARSGDERLQPALDVLLARIDELLALEPGKLIRVAPS
jgi:HPt (histidine-containing phosphotransfer) domain-containing protein